MRAADRKSSVPIATAILDYAMTCLGVPKAQTICHCSDQTLWDCDEWPIAKRPSAECHGLNFWS